MSLKSLEKEITGKKDRELSHFAYEIVKPENFSYYRETESLSSEEMDSLMETMVKELMDRNLVIPGGGVVDLMAVAQKLAPSFGDKYE